MSFLKVENLSFSYNGKKALSGISFSAEKGELLAVIGRNGSGKSTLLKALCGLNEDYSGDISVAGKNIKNMSPRELSKITAFVPGEIYSPFDFPADEIVLMGRFPRKKWWQDYGPSDFLAVKEVMNDLGIGELAGRSVNRISTGERQLVFLAQALAQDPCILVLDEPTSHLDLNFKMRFFELLLKVKKEKELSVVCVSHDLKLVSSFADKALVLKKGENVFFGPASGILDEKIISVAYDISDPEAIRKMV